MGQEQWCMPCNPSYLEDWGRRITWPQEFNASPRNIMRPWLKTNKNYLVIIVTVYWVLIAFQLLFCALYISILWGTYNSYCHEIVKEKVFKKFNHLTRVPFVNHKTRHWGRPLKLWCHSNICLQYLTWLDWFFSCL